MPKIGAWNARKVPAPYVAASSSITNPSTNLMESFSLSCPHVTDAEKQEVDIEVTWTLNNAIWLKIGNGNRMVDNKLTSYNKKTITGKNVLRISENLGRYMFDYDELTGDFSMEIMPVLLEEDAGLWQCHVTVHDRGNTHTLTSRRRVKKPHPHRHHAPAASSKERLPSVIIYNEQQPPPRTPSPSKINVFNRNQPGMVQIERDSADSTQMVVFDRRVPQKKYRSQLRDTVIDYEMSVQEEPIHYGR
ncbi:unnamed protein product, partial [Mesorhabditis spiculigera]